MNDTIICPHCNKPIPLTQALSHQVQEKYQKFYKQRLEEEKGKIQVVLREELAKKIKSEMEMQFKDKMNENDELQKQNKTMQEQLLELNKFIRQLKNENDLKKVEMEKKLVIEQEKIRQEEKKRFNDEYHLKVLEKEKQLNDALRVNEELKRKLEQGSQQTQGEVLELELEHVIKQEFPYDEIQPVPKGVHGADVIQIVKNNIGRECGKIIWESKRTKAWSEGWLQKLKEDQREVNADIAVIISNVLPDGIKHFGLKQDIWICHYNSFISLTVVLRDSLIKMFLVKASMAGKKEKKEILWNYLTGIEFKQRIEAIYDGYSQQQEEIEKEKRFFAQKWAREEKNVRKVIDTILAMNGDLQSIVGKLLPEIKGVELLMKGKEEKLF
ncbi:MAG: DUF2130 domain-containing protein [bacterium]|nr:DUF2130 domain-containing protein [bacterium]